MTQFVIDRCRCTGWSFAQLRYKNRTYDDIDAVMLETRAGALCHRCRPWLLRAIAEQCNGFEVDSDTVADGPALCAHFSPSEPPPSR